MRPLSGRRRERKHALRLLQAAANRHDWPKNRFNGLTPALYREIRAHYRRGNDAFAQQVWGASRLGHLLPGRAPN